jgi:hypothetical protein
MIKVTKAKLIENVYENFFDAVKSYDNKFSKIIYPSFPNVELAVVGSYPIIVLNSPVFRTEQKTMNRTTNEGRITFEIYTTSAKTKDEYSDLLKNAIETNKGTLADNGIHQVFEDISLDDTVVYGKVKVHSKQITLNFVVYTTKTFAY